MRFWREIVGDRWSGGTLCVLLALTLAVQIFVVGQAAAAMAATDASVLCSSAPNGARGPSEPGHRHECPCAELCGAGALSPASSPPADAVGLPIRFADRIEVVAGHPIAVPTKPFARQQAARAPPEASIRD